MGDKKNKLIASDVQPRQPDVAEQKLAGAGSVHGVWYGHNVNVAGMPGGSDKSVHPEWGMPAGAGTGAPQDERADKGGYKMFPNDHIIGYGPKTYNIFMNEIIGEETHRRQQ